ncbi:hypothetical protein HPB47_024399 [Ixodes persulcatus]|uniref:Uncharacterized protein n=1 Tax=Ixodes persulcatus TaxID=34615 RepID=A0AC60Q4E5_IXOPE|nr:hypothetical protein HPB47_024399 [Ixodes persulcatus]
MGSCRRFSSNKTSEPKLISDLLILKCGMCGYDTQSENRMMHQRRLHVSLRPLPDVAQEPEEGAAADKPSSKPKSFHAFSYDVRGFSDQNENSMMRHHSLHAGPPRLQCCTCGVEFPLQSSLTPHVLCHDSASPYQCDMCSRRFDTTVLVENHLRSHTGEQPFACGSGGKSFCEKAGATRCEEITHVGQRQQADHLSPEPCVRRVVPTNCTNVHGPQEVLQVPAPPGCLGETCHVCNEEFNQLPLLEAHTPSHLTAKPYMCDVCGARFRNLTIVKDHVRKHTRERPFACKVCGRTFVYRSSWINHAKTHPEQRPFACHLCSETFLLKRSLKDHHMQQHTNKQ